MSRRPECSFVAAPFKADYEVDGYQICWNHLVTEEETFQVETINYNKKYLAYPVNAHDRYM